MSRIAIAAALVAALMGDRVLSPLERRAATISTRPTGLSRTAAVVATHSDPLENLACVAAGHRRFTLFPPDQVSNLYPGPLEPTPGGQVVSMVDLHAADLDRFPRFADALAAAQVAELEPGDVLFYPALWWHHVEALAPFNVLVNYWWNATPAFADTPMTTLLHALLSLRDRQVSEVMRPRPEVVALDDHAAGDAGDRRGLDPPRHRQPERIGDVRLFQRRACVSRSGRDSAED